MKYRPIGDMWLKTSLAPPPVSTWFMGKYSDEVMPTYIIPDGPCISVRMVENHLQVCHHTLALPPEWRP